MFLASLKALGFGLLTLVAFQSMARPAAASALADFDDKSAVIFTYFAFDDATNPNGSIQFEQFQEQVQELVEDGYVVKSLPEIVQTFTAGGTLPPKTVALTFDGADSSIYQKALPLLEESRLPYTLFLPTDRVNEGAPRYMSWNNLRALQKTGLASFGLQPAGYLSLIGKQPEEIHRQINNARAVFRKELSLTPTLFAYPFGEYSSAYRKIVQETGFTAAFGQQSGVAYAGGDLFALPRFSLTERFGDIDRFRMTATALPLPVTDIQPEDPYLSALSPAIGFTLPEDGAANFSALSCFASGRQTLDVQALDRRRVELRLGEGFTTNRPRINCTMPAPTNGADGPARWRWFGMLLTVQDTLLPPDADEADEDGQQDHQSPDEIQTTGDVQAVE